MKKSRSVVEEFNGRILQDSNRELLEHSLVRLGKLMEGLRKNCRDLTAGQAATVERLVAEVMIDRSRLATQAESANTAASAEIVMNEASVVVVVFCKENTR